MSSQIKQGVTTRVMTSIRALANKKKKGKKVGWLKFKRSVRTIPLKQFGVTYWFTNGGTRVQLQGLPGSLRVRGFAQLPPGAELANAVFLKRASGYYLKVTVYTDRANDPAPPARPIGLDLGRSTNSPFQTASSWSITYQLAIAANYDGCIAGSAASRKGARSEPRR